ncbi:MAG: DUF3626 domain-containing protein [Actinomycetia bacterium]|nr:DUF3626 domain-containing protein [Actinomycetes bacterium]
MTPAEQAVATVRRSSREVREDARRRWDAVIPGEGVGPWIERFPVAGRITLNFHPDRIVSSSLRSKDPITVAAGLAADGLYRSQWTTGISNGGRSAVKGGEREQWERDLFAGAYDGTDLATVERPIYGALDLLRDPHGGSPRFGSSFVVLRSEAGARATMCVGDSHLGPTDLSTVDEPAAILAGLAEQAAGGYLLGRSLGTDALLAALDQDLASDRPARDLDHYVEVQIHGGVDLRNDVAAIVVDPSFAATEVDSALSTAAARYGFELVWHSGSELAVVDIPGDFRGPTMPALGRRVALAVAHGVVDAYSIGRATHSLELGPPQPGGDPPDSEIQQLKYLWHTVLAFGSDIVPRTS